MNDALHLDVQKTCKPIIGVFFPGFVNKVPLPIEWVAGPARVTLP